MAKKWGVLLVHGVGDTLSRDMIDNVGAAINAVHQGQKLEDWFEVVPPDSSTSLHPYPNDLWRQRGKTPSIEDLVYAQVYWADLSRIREDWLARLIGLFALIFGFRHIAHAAANQPTRLAQCLRGLLWFASFLLRGPVLALYLFALVYALLFRIMDGGGYPTLGAPASWLLFATGIVSVFVGLWLWWRNALWVAAPWTSLVLIGLAACYLAFASLSHPADGLGGALLEWALPWPDNTPDRAALQMADARFFLLLMLSIGTLLFSAATLSLLLALPLWALADVLARTSGHSERIAGLTAAYGTLLLQLSLSVLILAPASFVSLFALNASSQPKVAGVAEVFQTLWNDLYAYIGFQSISALLLGIAAALTVGWRVWLARPTANGPFAGPYPRLIANGLIIVLLFLIQIPFCVYDVVTTIDAWIGYPLDWDLINWLNRPGYVGPVALGLYAFLLGGFLLLPNLPGRDNPLHIVMDIVNHFLIRREGMFWRRPIGEVRPDGTLSHYALRNAIQDRFRDTLSKMLKEVPTHLVILAHSQGTMIALQGVREWDRKFGAPFLQHVCLVTMGSPFSHLYQHYFPDYYKKVLNWDAEFKAHKLDAWLNVYRVDDFVGTVIQETSPGWPANTQVEAGGHVLPGGLGAHTTYWLAKSEQQKLPAQLVFELFKGELPN